MVPRLDIRVSLLLLLLSALDLSAEKTISQEIDELLILDQDIDVKATDFIVLLGASSSGKNTLTRFLIKDPDLRAVAKPDGFIFSGTKDEVASSLLPQVFLDRISGQAIVDCPSFSGNSEVKNAIAITNCLRKVAKIAKRMKIILVENYFSLSEDEEVYGFEKLLGNVAEVLPNIAELKGAIGLVATKVNIQKLSDAAIKESILGFLKHVEEKSGPNSKQREILKEIIGKGDGKNIGLFMRPQQAGEVWNQPEISAKWQALRVAVMDPVGFKNISTKDVASFTLPAATIKLIEEVYIPFVEKEVTTAVSDALSKATEDMESKLAAKDTIKNKFLIAADLNAHYQSSMENLYDDDPDEGPGFNKIEAFSDRRRNGFWSKLSGNLKKMVAKSQKIIKKAIKVGKVLIDLVNKVVNILEKANKVAEVFSKNVNNTAQYYSSVNTLVSNLDQYGPQSQRKNSIKMVNSQNYQTFLGTSSNYKINIPEKAALQSFSPAPFMLDDLNEVLKERLDYPTVFSGKSINELIITSRNILMSEVNEKLRQTPNLKDLYLYAHVNVFFDQPLTLVGTNVHIVSPTVTALDVKPPPVLTTLGIDAANDFAKVAQGSAVIDGRAGLAGTNAGNILLVATQFTDSKYCSMVSSGGRGGKGQDGGDGTVGRVSIAPSFSNTVTNSEQEFANAISNKGYTFQRQGHNWQIMNSVGNVAPTRGGDGGAGGPGGLPGKVEFHLENIAENKVQLIKVGAAGLNGIGGLGGKGASSCARRHATCRWQTTLKPTGGLNAVRCRLFKRRCRKVMTYECAMLRIYNDFCPVMIPDAAQGVAGKSLLLKSDPNPVVNINIARVKSDVSNISRDLKNEEYAKLAAFVERRFNL